MWWSRSLLVARQPAAAAPAVTSMSLEITLRSSKSQKGRSERLKGRVTRAAWQRASPPC